MADTEFRTPTLNEVFRTELASMRNTMPEVDLSENSDYWRIARVIAFSRWQLYNPIAAAARQIFPETANSTYLRLWGKQLRLAQKQPAFSVGFLLLEGAAAAAVAPGARWTSATGVEIEATAPTSVQLPGWLANGRKCAWFSLDFPDRFIIDDITGLAPGDTFFLGGVLYCIRALPGGNAVFVYGRILGNPLGLAVIPSLGARVAVRAVATGAAGNIPYNHEVTIAAAPVGLNPIAHVLELSGGDDLEQEAAWAIRMNDERAEYPSGGNRAWVLKWTKSVLGVDRAFVYERDRGPGTTGVCPQGIARARHLSVAVQGTVQDLLSPAIPTDQNPGKLAPGCDLKVFDFQELPVTFSIGIEAEPGYGADWTGRFTIGVNPTVARIPLTASPIGKIAPGNRIAVRVGPFQRLVNATVESVDAAGLNLSPLLDDPPQAGDTVYPGGPLIDPAWTALEEEMDRLGPGDTTPPTRYPSPSQDAPSNLPLSRIYAAVQAIAGAKRVVIFSPAADVNPGPFIQATIRTVEILHI